MDDDSQSPDNEPGRQERKAKVVRRAVLHLEDYDGQPDLLNLFPEEKEPKGPPKTNDRDDENFRGKYRQDGTFSPQLLALMKGLQVKLNHVKPAILSSPAAAAIMDGIVEEVFHSIFGDDDHLDETEIAINMRIQKRIDKLLADGYIPGIGAVREPDIAIEQAKALVATAIGPVVSVLLKTRLQVITQREDAALQAKELGVLRAENAVLREENEWAARRIRHQISSRGGRRFILRAACPDALDIAGCPRSFAQKIHSRK